MTIKVISLNVDSIVSAPRKVLLTSFINSTRGDIYMFQETKLDAKIKLFVPNFNVIRSDVRRGYGGTAILIRNGIPFRNPTFGRDKINYVSIQIKIDGNWTRMSSVYVTHGHNDILTAFHQIFNTNFPILYGGDFNSRHTNFGDPSVNSYGTHLITSIQSYITLMLLIPHFPPAITLHKVHTSTNS